MSELIVIAPESKPGSGGVADYTSHLIEHLPNPNQISVITPPFDPEALPPAGGKVLLQYSAYGFDRYGYPKELIQNLINWKRRTGGRLAVMFHEIWAFWPRTNKNYFVQALHRRALKRLLHCVDLAFTSTADQLKHLRALSPAGSIHLLPVGTNIRRIETADGRREPGTAVLFGLQPGRISTLQRMQSELRELASSRHFSKLITAGAAFDPAQNSVESRLLSGLELAQGFEQRGALSEEAVSRLLLAASFAIFAQSELSYTKSGTFMAYAAHEVTIVSDSASKGEPACWLVAPAELIGGISETELRLRAEKLRSWQERTASWEIIAAKVADALGLGSLDRVRIESASR